MVYHVCFKTGSIGKFFVLIENVKGDIREFPIATACSYFVESPCVMPFG